MKNKLKGFTLVELIVVMAIISILMLAIMKMFQPIRDTYVDTTQYEAQRTAQNGVIQYITESVRYATDMGIYNDSISTASSAVDEFVKVYCIDKNITDASGNALIPYNDAGELVKIKNEIKKYADVIVIANDDNNAHTYSNKKYTGRLLRRKSQSLTLPEPSIKTAAPTSDWRIALGEAYYGTNTYSINLTVTDSDTDGISDDGMITVSVQSTKNGKRDISNAGKETTLTNNVTKGGVLCRNLIGSNNNGVTKQGVFDVSKYSGSSATSGTKTYIVFLNTDGKDKVDAEVKTAATSP
ncbi:MAG: type II secretion system GspH family protein [Oscillospiraceae bacterium]|nr:type II secretion system GspH family protein [Oscillospiraceae bacterium]